MRSLVLFALVGKWLIEFHGIFLVKNDFSFVVSAKSLFIEFNVVSAKSLLMEFDGITGEQRRFCACC